MNKLRPRNKICFQNYNNEHASLKIKKLKRKKWFFLKKRFDFKKEIKPEKKKNILSEKTI